MKVKKSLIIKESSEVKNFIEKNKRIPKSSTLSEGVVLSPYSVTYLMSSLIMDLKSTSYTLVDVIIYDSGKYADTINEKVLKEDYVVMVKNFFKYCKNNKRVPRYITTQKSKTKVSFELYMYCMAKILVFYQKNKTLPNYCLFDKSDLKAKQTATKNTKTTSSPSTSTNKKPANSAKTTVKKTANPTIFTSSPHPTKKGCGGMGQDTSYYCGVSALQKVLFKFGIKDYSQSTLAKWAGTTTAGTSHQGIATAVAMVNKKMGTKITITEKSFKDLGWKGIGKILANPKQDIIFHNCYRLKYGHYEVANQVNTNTNIEKVLNSLGDKCTSSCYCGYVESRSAAEFKKYMDAISQKSLIILTKN